MNLKELYQEIILEHGKNPRNLGKTVDFNKDAKGHNPLCGDNVHVYLKLNGQRIVEDISFEGSGCAISMASASIMTDLIKGKNENEAKEIVEDFLGMIKENPELKSEYLNEDEKTKLMCLSGVKQYPMRVKCATLSWHTLVSAFDEKTEEVKEIINDFLGMIKENPELRSKNLKEDEKTKLMCLSGVKQYPMRVKCATLSWHTLVSAFDENKEEVKTEN